MDKLILSPIDLTEFMEAIKQVIRAELLAAGAIKQDEPINKPLSQNELAKFLGVTIQTVIRWKHKGKIPFFEIGSAQRFDLPKVLKALGNEARYK
jgi:excisionase family DNA binding protein